MFSTLPHSFHWWWDWWEVYSSVTFIIGKCCDNLGGCEDKLIAASLSKMDSQHPPVQKLVTPKPVSLTGSRITYFKPSLKPATNSRKIHQRADTDHQVSKFSCPNLPAFCKLGMCLTNLLWYSFLQEHQWYTWGKHLESGNHCERDT